MKLEEFIESTLTNILQGVAMAQMKHLGQNIAAESYGSPSNPNLHHVGGAGMFTVVDFDIAVIVDEKDGGSIVQVGSLTSPASKETAVQNTSRIKFSVPVKLPEGAKIPRTNSASRIRSYDEMP